jgi:hypothetical protein
LPSLSAIERQLADLERRARARGQTDNEIVFINDPELNLEHLRVFDDGITLEIGDGKPQPETSPAEIERLAQLRKASLRLGDADNLLIRAETKFQVDMKPSFTTLDETKFHRETESQQIGDPMGEHPASDPPEPGSKLADIRRMRDGRQGGIRPAKGVEAVQPARSATIVADPVPKRVASNAPPKRVEKAKAVLKKAEARAKRGPKPKEGPKPWEALGLSKPTYFRRKKAGEL